MKKIKSLMSFLVGFTFLSAVLVESIQTTNCLQAAGNDFGFDVSANVPDEVEAKVFASNRTDTSHSFNLNISSETKYVFSTETDSPFKGVRVSSYDKECDVHPTILTTPNYDFDVERPDYKLVETDDSGSPIINEDGSFNFIPYSALKNGDKYIHNYKTFIPMYDGYVFSIVPETNQDLVIIPNYITYANRYVLKITCIGSNVFSKEATVDYHLPTTIVMGNQITKVEEDAFTVAGEDANKVTLNFIGSQSNIDLSTNWTNLNSQNIHFNYDIQNLEVPESATDNGRKQNKKKVINAYADGYETDANGNPVYRDKFGYQIDENGYYYNYKKNANGKTIIPMVIDGTIDESKAQYLESPYTALKATFVNFPSTGSKASEGTYVFGDYRNNRPMVLEYKFKNSSEFQYYVFPFDSTVQGLGNFENGTRAHTFNVDFHITKDQEVDPSSLVLRNIFEKGTSIADGYVLPNTAVEFKFVPECVFSNEFNVDEFIKVGNSSITTFNEYTCFTLEVDKVPNIYQKVNPSSWEQFKSKVESNDLKIRYSFTSFPASSYTITFVKNGTLVSKTISFNDSAENGLTLDFHLLTKDKGNKVSFLLKNSLVDEDFNAKSVRRVEYNGLCIKLDLMSTRIGTTQVVTKSDVITRFGYLDILPTQIEEMACFNCVSFEIILTLIYLVAYVIIGIAYYFFAKTKYKNDEFRRMNTKQYFKKFFSYLIQSLIVVAGIGFTIIRFGFLNPSVVVFNPTDALVIIFDVIGIVIVGLFIKTLVVVTKANKARKEAIKLKLNDDVADDGTK